MLIPFAYRPANHSPSMSPFRLTFTNRVYPPDFASYDHFKAVITAAMPIVASVVRCTGLLLDDS